MHGAVKMPRASWTGVESAAALLVLVLGCGTPAGGGGTTTNMNSPPSQENTNLNGAPSMNANGNDACVTGGGEGNATVSYEADVFPLLSTAGCMVTGCHGGLFTASLYNLSTYNSTFGPGDQARILGACDVVPGDPDASFIIEKLVDDSPRVGDRMPLSRPPLPDADIELIRTWILEGARNN